MLSRLVFILFSFGIFSFGIFSLGTAHAQIQQLKPLYQLKTPFNEGDFAWSQNEGTGVIAGQASLVAQGGFIKYPEDKAVVLVPRNRYTDEIVSVSREPGFFDTYSDVKKHPDYFKYRRVQKPDEKGHFRFDNLPAGEWYIATTILWYTRNQLGEINMNGGNVWGLIRISDSEARTDIHLNSTDSLVK